MPAAKTDAALLAEARSDADAFAEVCRRHAAALEAWFIRRTADPGIAADLTAETFAQAWRSRERFRDEAQGSAAPWLYGIAANLHRQYCRRRRVETAARRRLGMPLRDFAVELDAVESRLDSARLGPALRAAVAALPPRQREAVELRVVRELPYPDIASRLGCSLGVARLNVSRALVSLRARLQEVKP